MPLLTRTGKTIQLTLKKDLSRAIKQGHAWLYSDALDTPSAASGSVAVLRNRKGEIIASGIYCPHHPISLRVCNTQPPFELDDLWLTQRLRSAIHLRKLVFDRQTTGYRLINGEGDRIPGLIIDIYHRTAVIKLDGGAPEAFFQAPQIADWLAEELALECVIYRARGRGTSGNTLYGIPPQVPVHFLENGMLFEADVISGQKTGFFLDQRDNRDLIRGLSAKRQVLNLFSFSGGFSVAAGVGGAESVHSVDIAPQAIIACHKHWLLNKLQPDRHTADIADCFDWLQQAIHHERRWDLVICDPPSLSPSQQTRQNALAAYSKLAQWTCQLVKSDGLLGLASCSSHITLDDFRQCNLTGFGKARRQARLLCQRCLPLDHPTPLAMPELRYLKFQLFCMS